MLVLAPWAVQQQKINLIYCCTIQGAKTITITVTVASLKMTLKQMTKSCAYLGSLGNTRKNRNIVIWHYATQGAKTSKITVIVADVFANDALKCICLEAMLALAPWSTQEYIETL